MRIINRTVTGVLTGIIKDKNNNDDVSTPLTHQHSETRLRKRDPAWTKDTAGKENKGLNEDTAWKRYSVIISDML